MKKIITTMLTACLCAAFLGACNQEQSSKGYLDVNDDNSENIVIDSDVTKDDLEDEAEATEVTETTETTEAFIEGSVSNFHYSFVEPNVSNWTEHEVTKTDYIGQHEYKLSNPDEQIKTRARIIANEYTLDSYFRGIDGVDISDSSSAFQYKEDLIRTQNEGYDALTILSLEQTTVNGIDAMYYCHTLYGEDIGTTKSVEYTFANDKYLVTIEYSADIEYFDDYFGDFEDTVQSIRLYSE